MYALVIFLYIWILEHPKNYLQVTFLAKSGGELFGTAFAK